MLVTNNDKVGKWFIYKVNGGTKRVQIPGMTTVELPDLTSQVQIIKNQYDLKVAHINSFLSRDLDGDFSTSPVEITPSPLIANWYAALSVKPSNALLTSLNTLMNGLDSDGDLIEMDFIAITAGMETEEQALMPLKTTGAATMTKTSITQEPSSALTWTVSGYPGNGEGYILSNYNPTINGSKYTLNSVCVMHYVSVIVVPSSGNGNFMGGGSTPDGVQDSETFTQATWNSTSMSTSNGQFIPNSQTAQTLKTITQTVGVGTSIMVATVRSAATASYAWINNQRSSVRNTAPIYIPNVNFGYFGVNYYDESILQEFGNPPTSRAYSRCGIIGSGAIGLERVGSRLNDFFASRGLSVYA